MSSSDAAANAALDREVRAGGSWWVALLLTVPDDALANALDEAPVSRVELPRTSAAWESASGRSVHPAADVAFTDPAPVDFTPMAWALCSGSTGANAEYAGRLVDVDVPAGSTFAIPAEALTLNFPADPFQIF